LLLSWAARPPAKSGCWTPTSRSAFTCLAPRVEDHEYDVDHGALDGQWTWFIRSNRDGINFALYTVVDSGTAPSEADWQNLIPHSDSVMLDGLSLNAGAMTLSLREGGLPIIEVHPQGLPATACNCRTRPTACTCRTAWSSSASGSACATKR
jgi:protease II